MADGVIQEAWNAWDFWPRASNSAGFRQTFSSGV